LGVKAFWTACAVQKAAEKAPPNTAALLARRLLPRQSEIG